MKKLPIAAAACFACLLAAPVQAGSDDHLGEVITVAFTFCPRGYAPVEGATIQIPQNTALFALLGNNFGGDGKSNFMLPNLTPLTTKTGATLLQCIAVAGVFPMRP